ncbi:cytochrome b/b6 domain-containing protein [Auritidibacter ignavus]|uniref:cytochrome b/b6 domain-containing protein n=1 Tax=Auritidibacter ignavus TaxID=678932 RepID=UPI00244D38FB|nr:cytochrome b/b6 domain-containing protein [Auritidibacter ignavus]WGH81050.1 cytochrome b/b6 domain-containing protein [Auritidibacter ignavus]WGH85652.1 cytochrome b/b6 domain-containing protein [Auritidibacter ignavus]WGH87941.1 cytochrome b/b6 domain-containing protein [Auritidibacter ignavus]
MTEQDNLRGEPSRRRMAGWTPLTVENPHIVPATRAPINAPADQQTPPEPATAQPTAAQPAPQPSADTPARHGGAGTFEEVTEPAPLPAGRRRMTGWTPLNYRFVPEHTGQAVTSAAPSTSPASAPEADATTADGTATGVTTTAQVVEVAAEEQSIPAGRRRMAGWSPLKYQRVASTPQPGETTEGSGASQQPAVAPATVATHDTATATTAGPTTSATAGQGHVEEVSTPETAPEGRRRMAGWTPLKYRYVPAQPAEATAAEPEQTESPATTEQSPPSPQASAQTEQSPASSPTATTTPSDTHLAANQAAAQPTAAAAQQPSVSPRPKEKKPLSPWTKRLLGLAGVLVLAVVVVLFARWLRSLDPVAEFIATYDGHSTQPADTPEGFPWWMNWAHFFNFFLMVLIVRTGLLIRTEQRPEAYWRAKKKSLFSPFKDEGPKVTIHQFTHQALDLLWVLNGVIFVILLFATGHWARIVPTDWDIFPNMVSAGIQYASLDWPAEDAWAHYNALQVVAYFIVVFIASPIAIITGLRMSTWWPKNNATLNKIYPAPLARKLHFPTMIFFVAFVIVHVFLVFMTGALTNLNYMFTGRDTNDVWGLLVFLLALAVTVGATWLIKPMIISPVAQTTGTVSSR